MPCPRESRPAPRPDRGAGSEHPTAKPCPMHPSEREPISPELVLVDPELAARVRPHAVAGPSVAPAPALERKPAAARPEQAATALAEPVLPPPAAAPREPAQPAPVEPVLPAPVQPANRPVRHRRSLPGRLASAATTLAAVALLAAAFLPPRDPPRFTDAAPPATAAPRASVTLAWQPAPDADYYLVEIFSGQRLVHAQSTRTTSVEAPAWLSDGRYTWRVFSGHGRPAARITRGPLESGWFLVRP
jgi:hypothetical protein